jgi:Secretion system C-terminal sorting domain/Pregnancy-associated plasma protein-A
MKYTWMLLVLLVVVQQVAGQNCGTVPTNEQLEFMDLIHHSAKSFGNLRKTNFSKVRVPVKLHFIRSSNGSGGVSEAQIGNLLDKVNGFYSAAGMEFFQHSPVNLINNDLYFNLNSDNEGAVAVPNDVPGVINIYFSNTLLSGGTPLCGYTRFPPSVDRVFVTYSCSFNGSTLEHELGHYFTLFHTHGVTNNGTTDELVNGSNCSLAGDRVCDTPADPNLSGKVSSSCIYTGVNRDPNGDLFAPQVRNFMSYSLDFCRDLFTQGQYDRIRNGYEEGRSYLLVQNENFTANVFTLTRKVCKGATVDFLATGSGAVKWNWEFIGGSPSTSILKQPKINYSTAGVFPVKLTAETSSGEKVIVEKLGFITVIDPLQGALSGTRFYDLENSIPDGFTIVNPDQSITFGYTPFDSEANSTGSVFLNNFNYVSDNSTNYDRLLSPYFSNLGVKRYDVSFSVAYAPRLGGLEGDFIRPDRFDSLSVGILRGCDSKVIQLWKEGGDQLSTAPISDFEFTPAIENWKKVEFSVNAGNEEFVQFDWLGISRNGNNLYIDKIEIKQDYTVSAPTNLRIASVLNDAILVRWTDNSINETGFTLERSTNGGNFEVLSVLPKNAVSYTDVSLSSGNLYSYRIFANGFSDFVSPTIGPVSVNFVITGVEDDFDIEIYPNPTSNFLTIENGKMQVYTIELYSIDGKKVFEGELDGLDRLTIQSENFVSGIYLLKLKSDKSVLVKKIMFL